ncbi:MAG TPA: hypothetical protein VEI02_02085 [Planctomycetota bacterium]|nr:hypothetical protein [Planctomycetota bacterium]
MHDLCRLVGTSVDVYAQQEKVDLQLRRNEERARLKGDRAEELRWRRERRVEPRE